MRAVSVARGGSRAAGFLMALLLLVSCGTGEGGDGSRPTISPTRTPTATLPSPELPTPTRSIDRTEDPELPSPTRSIDRTEDPESPSPTRTPEQSETPSEPATEPSSEPPSEEPVTETPAPTAEETEEPGGTADDEAVQEEDEGVATWVWWLLGVLVALSVAAIPLAMRARRRSAWQQELDDQEGELAWFARELLPGLRQAGSREQVAGGWAVGQGRAAAAEDRLTVLESTAPDEAGRLRARSLRDAARQARAHMDRLTGPESPDTWALDLDKIIADLEMALRPVTSPE